MTSERIDFISILALIVAVNVSAGAAPSRLGAAILQGGVAGFAVVGALSRGYTVSDLALSPGSVASGVRWGMISAGVIIAGVILVAVVPITRRFFSDDRFANISGGEVLYETAFRIPVVTALTEEILFRSVLLGILLTLAATQRAVLIQALLFGLWHVVTTLGDLSGNDVTGSLTTWGRVGAVVATVVATGAAGVFFGWLRVRSGSVVAPWIAHVSFNAATFLAGVVVVRNEWI